MTKDLQQFMDEFINECRYSAKLAEDSLGAYRACFDLFLKLMPGTTPGQISSQIMTTFFQKLHERKRMLGKSMVRTGVKSSTVATYRSKLNRFFNWLKQNGHIKINPFDSMAYPNVTYEDRKYIAKDKLEKIIIAVTHNIDWTDSFVRKRNYVIISLPLYCGLRRGELLGMKMYDVDLGRRQVTVQAQTSKSKRQRVVPLNSKIAEILKDYIQARKQKNYSTPYLLVSNNGDSGLTKGGLKHLIRKINDESGVRFHIHQLRHTFAVNLLNNGSDVAKLKQLMGHRDIRMTAAYLRCLPTKALRGDVETLALDNFL